MSAEWIDEWQEFRAVYRVPASLLDSEQERARGWVTRRTGAHRTVESACRDATHRSEETLASVVGYEVRTVKASEWRTA